MIKKIFAAYKRDGIIQFIKSFLIRLTTTIAGFFIALFIVSISPWVKIIFIRLFSERIGHFALNTELLLCAQDLTLFPENKSALFLFYTVPGAPICNTQLYKMWKRVIPILPLPYLWNQVDVFLKKMLGKKYQNNQLKITFEPAEGAIDRWNFLEKNNSCHISFTATEEKKGRQLLNQLGIPSGSRFICLLGRDSQYLKTHLPSVDWSYHDYRDVDINQYQLVADFLAKQGYYVVRMGKQTNIKFKTDNPQIIDYANHPLRSDFMDMYLTANCFFFISPRSGIDAVAQIFRRPLLLTNFPLCDYHALYYIHLLIPKKMINLKDGKLLNFSEMCKQIDRKKMLKHLEDNGSTFIDNTPEELLAVTEEMLNRLLNTWKEPDDNENLQEKFWQQIPLKKQDNVKNSMRIGDSFIRNHQSLMENE